MAVVENAVIQAYGLKKMFFVLQVLILQIRLTTEVYMERNLILSQEIFSFICPAISYLLLPSQISNAFFLYNYHLKKLEL